MLLRLYDYPTFLETPFFLHSKKLLTTTCDSGVPIKVSYKDFAMRTEAESFPDVIDAAFLLNLVVEVLLSGMQERSVTINGFDRFISRQLQLSPGGSAMARRLRSIERLDGVVIQIGKGLEAKVFNIFDSCPKIKGNHTHRKPLKFTFTYEFLSWILKDEATTRVILPTLPIINKIKSGLALHLFLLLMLNLKFPHLEESWQTDTNTILGISGYQSRKGKKVEAITAIKEAVGHINETLYSENFKLSGPWFIDESDGNTQLEFIRI